MTSNIDIREVKKKLMRDKYLLLMLLPGIAFFILFRYLPMGGLIIAFKDYNIFRSIWEAEWVGFKHFRDAFSSTVFWVVLRNTLIISSYKIIFGFPAPIILSLMLNEIRSRHFKKAVQTIIYLPHFISWVVIHGVMLSILSPTYGIAGNIFRLFNLEPINLMASPRHFRALLVISEIWKEVGRGTIVYLASLSTIDPNLYEAAIVDGANKLRQIWYITLPSLAPVIVLFLILRIGSLLSAGFEQVLVMQNDLVRPVSDIFETYVYRRGIARTDNYSYTTAIGMFSSVISLVLIVAADRFAKLVGEEGLL